MEEPIIRGEGVGKQYMLRHRELNRGLRHVFTDALSGLTKIFGKGNASGGPAAKHGDTIEEFWALKDVSFEIKQGDAVGLVGRNGSGKSTLLKILSRITEPTRGRVSLGGRVASLLEVGTGFHPELTGRENIFLNGTILGMTRRDILRKMDEIVAFAEVDRFLDTPVKHYSSGMYVRLAFAVAAHLEPEILIVDEVLAVGDAAFQKKCLGKMGEVANKEGRTVLFVSHNMGAISTLTRKAIYLNSGRMVMMGDTQDVVARYLGETYEKGSIWRAPRATQHPIQVTGLSVRTAAGVESNIFEASEGFGIELEYVVRRPVEGVIIEAFICSADGVQLVTMGEHDRDRSALERKVPGRYRRFIQVPGDWLNLGTYYMRVGSCLITGEIFDSEEVLSFSIVENMNNFSRYGRRGAMLPMLPWRVVEDRPDPA